MGIASSLFAPAMRAFYWDLFAPVMFVALLAPDVLAVGIPCVLANALSSRPAMHLLAGHNSVTVMPIAYCAAIIAIERIARRAGKKTAMVAFVGAGLCTLATCAPIPLLGQSRVAGPCFSPTSTLEVQRLLSTIPARASVSAEPAILPAVSQRDQVYFFPNPFMVTLYGPTREAQLQYEFGDARQSPPPDFQDSLRGLAVDYIVLSSSQSAETALSRKCAIDAVVSSAYGIVAITRNAILLRRGADRAAGIAMLTNTYGRGASDREGVTNAYDLWTDLQHPGS